MKVLLHHFTPFALAHGGEQIQIERTLAALAQVGLDVDHLHWYDGKQMGDVIHFFGRVPNSLMKYAHDKGMKVVLAELLTDVGSRSPVRLGLDRVDRKAVKRVLPEALQIHFEWNSYLHADACVALTSWEARLLVEQFDTPQERVHVVPNGVEDIFLENSTAQRGQWLVCTATITERKRVLELAAAALHAETPLWVIGKPYSESDLYGRRFLDLARQNPRLLRYEGPVADRARLAQIYREARGFVLLSAMESLSLSALEAAACHCAMLLSDLPWARTVFGKSVWYCPVRASEARTGQALREFYDAAPRLMPPPKPCSWLEVAQQLKAIYENLLRTSR